MTQKLTCSSCKKDRDIISSFSLNDDTTNYTLSCRHLVVITKEPFTLKPELVNSSPIPYTQGPSSITKEFLGFKREIDSKYSIKSLDSTMELYPFQQKGVEFIDNAPNHHCLIGDEMGLGKMIQALGWMKIHPEKAPFLIIVKSSIRVQWFITLLRWLGRDYLPQIITSAKDVIIPGFPVYIVSVDLLSRFLKDDTEVVERKGITYTREVKKSQFHSFNFKTVIIDECQSIKNPYSNRAIEVTKICESAENVIALSGTPIKNNAAEYYTILHILNPNLFPSYESFKWKWVAENYSGGLGGLTDPISFHEQTKSFIIRRTREEAMPDLPTITRSFYKADFDSNELKKRYEKAQKEFIKLFEKVEHNKATSSMELLALINALRHIAGIAAIQPAIEFITEFIVSTERKLVVFTHHVDVNEALKKLLEELDIPVLNLHSGLEANARAALIQKFHTSDKHRILLASTLAAGEGLNLQFCSDCLFVERQWNPANEEQGEGRFIRIGQKESKVMATYIVVINTIAEWFTELVEKKRAIMKSTLDNVEIPWEENSLMSDLMNTIVEKGRKSVYKGF